jgi:hypothetical protein
MGEGGIGGLKTRNMNRNPFHSSFNWTVVLLDGKINITITDQDK